MKLNGKRWLSALLALTMALCLAAPALATEGGDDTTTNLPATKQFQITKALKIGQGITVPDETFAFTFAPAETEEAAALGEDGVYIDPSKAHQGNVGYPDLNTLTQPANRQVAYTSATRTATGTDEELTFAATAVDLGTLTATWPEPGLYIYSVKETAGSTTGMTYDPQTYYLKVYVKNGTNGPEVDSVAVYGKDSTDKWVKVDGAPKTATETSSDENDGCADYVGNDFKFTNTYRKVVDKHPINLNTTSGDTDDGNGQSDYAFKLTKDVVGDFASKSHNFDFQLSITLPESYANFGTTTVRVNGYTANKLMNNTTSYAPNEAAVITIDPTLVNVAYLHHGDSLSIDRLPVGTKIQVTEVFSDAEGTSNTNYIPSFKGKWLGSTDQETAKTGTKATNLATATFVVGEQGAYVQYTNTLNDSDVTATGIAIRNLPYILMVAIALLGIGFLTVSRKRRA